MMNAGAWDNTHVPDLGSWPHILATGPLKRPCFQ
jgi:hypothetical protein